MFVAADIPHFDFNSCMCEDCNTSPYFPYAFWLILIHECARIATSRIKVCSPAYRSF